MRDHRVSPRRSAIVTFAMLLLLLAGSGLPVVSGESGRQSSPVASPSDPATPSTRPAGGGSPVIPPTRAGTPDAGSPVPATPAGTPAATPVVDLDCTGPCLVRFEPGPELDASLASSGLRASYRTATAVWVGGTPADLGLLVAGGVSPVFIMDETPSLMLYAVTSPVDDGGTGVIDAFGQTVDREGTTAIVATPTVPAYIIDLVAAGLTVEKLAPYVPARTPSLTTDSITALPGVTGVTETFPDLSAENIDRTIRELSSTGVAPGEIGSRFFSLPGNAIAAEYLYLRFAAYGLTVTFEDYIASNGILSVNVVAEIPGTDDSRIFAGFAHFDTITEDVPDNDTSAGSLDNATGLAVLLENARVLSGYRLHHPIRFVALNGEEVGLQGANAFGARHADLGTPFVGGINIDSVGTAYGARVLYVNASAASAFIQDTLLEQYDAFGFQLNVAPLQSSLIVADEVPLTNYGIPTILVASILYGDPLINCTCDTIDGVDIDYVRATARLVMVTFATLVAPPA